MSGMQGTVATMKTREWMMDRVASLLPSTTAAAAPAGASGFSYCSYQESCFVTPAPQPYVRYYCWHPAGSRTICSADGCCN
jgi:hypothetical protein